MSRRQLLPEWQSVALPLIGMLHLLPLPDSPGYLGDMRTVRDRLLADAEALSQGGANGLLLENLGDRPYYPNRVPPHIVAHMSELAILVRRTFDLPVGISVLRNDAHAALAVASACGGRFIRVNVLCGARVTDQGILQGEAHQLLRYRSRLAADVKIWADVGVKHSAPMGVRRLEEESAETVDRGLADALVVTGEATGDPALVSELRAVRAAAPRTPIVVGSGVRPDNAARYRGVSDAVIAGTSLKRNADPEERVDLERVRMLRNALVDF